MNYRHAYHAGNFADVLKHAVLALVITHLKLKPAAFRVIDTHAGRGRYDLGGAEATRTGEWRDGIGRIAGPAAEALPEAIAELLAPYLDAVGPLDPSLGALTYPGSPALALALMRGQDRLIANELHPEDRAGLEAQIGGDFRAKVLGMDGWQALRALLPPKERRGVILVDPPFEEPGELERLVQGLTGAVARFATGTYLLWHPIKDAEGVSAFRQKLAATGLPKMLSIELWVADHGEVEGLAGSGLVILNPPFRLEAQLQLLLPFLSGRLARGAGATSKLSWLTPERVSK
jgi:23S rRNA (adenine2030-N6)-methyltransferase